MDGWAQSGAQVRATILNPCDNLEALPLFVCTEGGKPKLPALSGCHADGREDVGTITSPEQEAVRSGCCQMQDLRSDLKVHQSSFLH